MFDDEKILRYFTEDEFRRSSFCLPSETSVYATIIQDPISLLDWPTLKKLDQTRDYAGIPFRLSCSYRSRAWDISKGRSGKGAHTKGYAFDIEARTDHQRFLILRAAVLNGWRRIGIAKTYIHLDNDPGLPKEVLWLY